MTIREFVLSARARLVAAGIDPNEAAMDAELLARHVLEWDRSRFLAHDIEAAPPTFRAAFDTLVARRERREPVSEILGRREFWGLDFEVTRDVLTPRPETEILLEEALSHVSGKAPARVVDVGTGSGCLAVCLARELPGREVTATDVSAAALAVARRNAERHGVAGLITFRQTSLLEGLRLPFDLIISNPPYVPHADLPALPPEVRDYEPVQALDGGADGLDVIRALMRDAGGALTRGGLIAVEFGYGQEAGVRQAVSAAGLQLITIRADLQGIPRTVVAKRG